MKKIMIVGNSHSVDAFQLLREVFLAQEPERELTIGYMYYSGCSINQHIDFGTNDKPVYRYCKNIDGKWIRQEEATLAASLADEPWDLIFLQAAKSDLTEDLNLEGRRTLDAFVDKYVPTPHEFAWHTSWPSPDDDTFFAPDYVRQPPKTYKERLTNLYGFNQVNQFTVLTEQAKKNILPDSKYVLKVCTGAGIMYARRVMGVSKLNIWRDYTHLSDFGRLIAAYSMYVQLIGKPLTEVKLDVVPTNLRYLRYKPLGDFKITQGMKQVILESANHSLEDPWTVPGE